jgi:hypothetical protein
MKKLACLFFCLLIFLSGCVRYDLELNFPNSNSGTILQHIRLGEQLTSFSQREGNAWFSILETRAKKLHGKTTKISPEEIVITIPFANGQDLVSKFNTFFADSTITKNVNKEEVNNEEVNKEEVNNEEVNNEENKNELIELKAEMSIKQSNLLFVERNKLNISADLSSLGVVSEEGDVIFSSGDLIDLEIQFNFPWGVKLSQNEPPSPTEESTSQFIWKLQPGQINQTTAIFWLPNYVGLGTLAISLFILLGFYVKYKQFPLVNS